MYLLIFNDIFTIIGHGGIMKKLTVNDSCIGCGACIAVDSDHFDFNEEGQSQAISNDNLDSAELQNAISSCPVNAIKIVDGTDDKCDDCSDCHGACAK